MSTDLEIVDLTEIVGEIETPCDYGDGGVSWSRPGTVHGPARWALFLVNHGCGSAVRLACTNCKDGRMMSDDAVECIHCGHITTPAREAYSRIEAL